MKHLGAAKLDVMGVKALQTVHWCGREPQERLAQGDGEPRLLLGQLADEHAVFVCLPTWGYLVGGRPVGGSQVQTPIALGKRDAVARVLRGPVYLGHRWGAPCSRGSRIE